MDDTSAAKRQLEELRRHNETMEAIALAKILYLKTFQKGLGLHLHPYLKKPVRQTRQALTNADVLQYGRLMGILHFHGVYMRNAMAADGLRRHEAAIVNLDDKAGLETHLVAYRKRITNFSISTASVILAHPRISLRISV